MSAEKSILIQTNRNNINSQPKSADQKNTPQDPVVDSSTPVVVVPIAYTESCGSAPDLL